VVDIKFTHIGWAVNSIVEASNAFEVLGYFPVGEICRDEQRNVNLLLLKDSTDAVIELVAPAAENSPVSEILAKVGPTPYHICCSICKTEWEECKQELKKSGFMILHKPLEAPLLDNKEVVFLYSKHIGLIELVLK